MSLLVKLLGGSTERIPLSRIVDGRRVVLVEPSVALTQAAMNWDAKGLLVLDKHTPIEAVDQMQGNFVRRQYGRLKDVYTNNCDIAVLGPAAALIFAKKYKFQRFATVLIPTRFSWLFGLSGLMRYAKRGDVTLAGETEIATGKRCLRYAVVEINKRSTAMRRQYAPAGLTPLEILQSISDLDAVLLRGAPAIADERHQGDIDLLISATDVARLRARFDSTIGTYPIDVYTDDGSGGYTHDGAPYYAPHVAKNILASAVIDKAGIKVPSPKMQFISYCYHLLFHGKLRPGAEREPLSGGSFFSPGNFAELQRAAQIAGQDCPKAVDELESVLREARALPSFDLISFYSNSDSFLKQRYFDDSTVPAGLATFFLRDFDCGPNEISAVRRELQKTFEIVREGPVTGPMQESIRRGVRGGNWTDKDSKSGKAEAVYWFVCWDPAPARPSFRNRRKYPRLDNQNVRLKDRIRKSLGGGHRAGRGLLHSSDNTREALDHLEALGLTSDANMVAFLKSKNIPIRSQVDGSELLQSDK